MALTRKQALLKAARLYFPCCFYCKVKPSEHTDHIIPSSVGGEDSAENLIGSCASCNCRKGQRGIPYGQQREALQLAWINTPEVNHIAMQEFYTANRKLDAKDKFILGLK